MASGGKREGAGRKALPEGERKVQMVFHVTPSTKDKILSLSQERNIPLGRIIDELIEAY